MLRNEGRLRARVGWGDQSRFGDCAHRALPEAEFIITSPTSFLFVKWLYVPVFYGSLAAEAIF